MRSAPGINLIAEEILGIDQRPPVVHTFLPGEFRPKNSAAIPPSHLQHIHSHGFSPLLSPLFADDTNLFIWGWDWLIQAALDALSAWLKQNLMQAQLTKTRAALIHTGPMPQPVASFEGTLLQWGNEINVVGVAFSVDAITAGKHTLPAPNNAGRTKERFTRLLRSTSCDVGRMLQIA